MKERSQELDTMPIKSEMYTSMNACTGSRMPRRRMSEKPFARNVMTT